MATGIVEGFPVYRDTRRSIHTLHGSRLCPTSRSSTMSSLNGSHGHRRTYSEIDGQPGRPRLPSISIFLEGAGRPDLNHKPTLQSPSSGSTSRSGPYNGKPPLSSPAYQRPWSPNDDIRQKMQLDNASGFHSRPVSSDYFSDRDYKRKSSVALPSLSHSEARSDSTYSMPSINLDSSPTQTNQKSVVREDYIDGRGTCYVYDDGSVCQKTINGDTVNPKWGTTKAGKPRKRLGQACNTCREKKIKCDPSYPKCTQCQKFGRECKFEAPTRIVQNSPRLRTTGSSPSVSVVGEDNTGARRSSAAPTEASTYSDSAQTVTSKTNGHQAERSTYRMPSPRPDDSHRPTPTKRMRLQSRSPPAIDLVTNEVDAPVNDSQHTILESSFSRDVDPYITNPKMTKTYLKAYFSHINTTTFGLVPEKLFMRWVERGNYKSPASKLLMYCMLAVGCTFANTADSTSHGKIFSDIANEGVTQTLGQFSVELIHARLIFALHEFQTGRELQAWDLGGAAMRTACAMKLNTEEGIYDSRRTQQSVYGLEFDQLSECLRRTFWTAFMMDRFAVGCLGYATTFNRADLFLRLPCTDSAYESGRIPETHVFDGEEGIMPLADAEQSSKLGSLAYLVQIASLGCDVHILATRAKHQGSAHRSERYTSLRSNLEQQLQNWERGYQTYLTSNRTQGPGDGATGPALGGLHIIYHHAYMILHRHVHHSALDESQIAHHAKEAYEHACTTLEIAQQLVSKSYKRIRNYHVAATSAVSGYAIVAAIDILTAAGVSSDLLENDGRLMRLMMEGGMPLLDALAENWSSAKQQRELISDRTKLLFNSLRARGLGGKTAFYVTAPIEQAFGKNDDLVYGVDRVQYFEAMGWGSSASSFSDMIEVIERGRRGS